jgi:preprotein translocase subunit YajC
MLYALMLLFAQVEEKAADPQPRPPGLFDNPMLLILAVVLMFFFIVIFPKQRREQKQRDALLSNLKKNDEVVTAAGIIGVVSSIKEGADEVTLKIDDNARIRVLKSTIIKIVSKESKEGT